MEIRRKIIFDFFFFLLVKTWFVFVAHAVLPHDITLLAYTCMTKSFVLCPPKCAPNCMILNLHASR